jgi:alginate O-acetyltransferase complex protein AlgI
MSFTSLPFIFLFLPILLATQYLIPMMWVRNLLLFASSVAFYAWVDPQHLWLLFYFIIVLSLFNLLSRSFPRDTKLKLLVSSFFLVLTLLPMVLLKYWGFMIENLNRLAGLEIDWSSSPLPLGLSFITFSCLAYQIDVSRGMIEPEMNVLHLSNFVTLFPKLTQGPITRFNKLKENLRNRNFDLERAAAGIRRFIRGFAKKIILADSLAVVGDRVFNLNPGDYGILVALFGLISFGLQIYLDFSGYTDMAIGLGQMIGFDLPENFDFPYWSKSISEFWRRWHITLSTWFRDYIFIPLERHRRNSKILIQPVNIMIVFLLTGFWHGASWNFIIWGAFHGLMIIVENLGLTKLLAKLPRVFQHMYAIGLIFLSWIFFRIEDTDQWVGFIKTLLGGNGLSGVYTLRSLNILVYWPILLMSLLVSVPIKKFADTEFGNSAIYQAAETLYFAGLFILSISLILSRGYVAFLYQQF